MYYVGAFLNRDWTIPCLVWSEDCRCCTQFLLSADILLDQSPEYNGPLQASCGVMWLKMIAFYNCLLSHRSAGDGQ